MKLLVSVVVAGKCKYFKMSLGNDIQNVTKLLVEVVVAECYKKSISTVSLVIVLKILVGVVVVALFQDELLFKKIILTRS